MSREQIHFDKFIYSYSSAPTLVFWDYYDVISEIIFKWLISLKSVQSQLKGHLRIHILIKVLKLCHELKKYKKQIWFKILINTDKKHINQNKSEYRNMNKIFLYIWYVYIFCFF